MKPPLLLGVAFLADQSQKEMNVTISYNEEKKGIELYFDEKLNHSQQQRLRTLGFKKTKVTGTNSQQVEKWFVKEHPAYREYAANLQKGLELGVASLEEVVIYPSYEPNLQNIQDNRFSVVTIFFKEDDQLKEDEYVVFDQFVRVATDIALRFGRWKYDNAFKEVKVYSRTYKPKARNLLKEAKVLDGKKEYPSEGEKNIPPISDQPSIEEQEKPTQSKDIVDGNEKETHRPHSLIQSRSNDYVYEEIQEFWLEVLYQVTILKGISSEEAHEIVNEPQNAAYGVAQYWGTESPNLQLAYKVAKQILDGPLPDLDKSRDSNITKFFHWLKSNETKRLDYDKLQAMVRQWTKTEDYDYEGETLEFIRRS